jgi:hypothetical protein
MKKNLLITTICFTLCLSANAQITSSFSPIQTGIESDSVFTEAGCDFYYYLGSNSINNHFVSDVYNSKFLDEYNKNSNFLKGKNVLGSDLYTGAYVAVMPDSLFGSSNLGYRIGFGTRQFRSVRFTNDLYNLIFFGNKEFAGETVDFDNTKFNLIDFQELQLGFFKDYQDNGMKIRGYFGLNILKGQMLQRLNVISGSFYTAEDGEYIDLDTKFRYYTSDMSHKKFSDFNGVGLSCDAYIRIEDVKSKMTFTFSSQDLGYIVWTKNSYVARVDTTMHFDGVEISNVLTIAESSLHGVSKDSLMDLIYAHNDTTPLTISLPERLTLEVQKEWNGFIKTTLLGMNYIFDTGQPIPRFYLIQTFRFTSKLDGGLIANYGGFSRFNAGVLLQYHSGKHISVGIASGDLSGFIIPADAFARSIMFNACYKF